VWCAGRGHRGRYLNGISNIPPGRAKTPHTGRRNSRRSSRRRGRPGRHSRNRLGSSTNAHSRGALVRHQRPRRVRRLRIPSPRPGPCPTERARLLAWLWWLSPSCPPVPMQQRSFHGVLPCFAYEFAPGHGININPHQAVLKEKAGGLAIRERRGRVSGARIRIQCRVPTRNALLSIKDGRVSCICRHALLFGGHASRRNASLGFGCLNDSAGLVGNLDRTAGLYCDPVF
jgi:hypothetical protein